VGGERYPNAIESIPSALFASAYMLHRHAAETRVASTTKVRLN